MAELSELRTLAAAPQVVAPAAQVGRANNRILEFLFGAQRIFLDEIVFATDEWLDRARTETHLFAEFASKVAGAHSVNNVKTMYEECGQHQIDFIRRDCERLFKHNQHMAEAVSSLLAKSSNG